MELARHFEQAHLWKKALEYTERAGMYAQNIYAYREAIKLFTKAVTLAQQMKNPKNQAQNLNNIGKVHVSLEGERKP